MEKGNFSELFKIINQLFSQLSPDERQAFLLSVGNSNKPDIAVETNQNFEQLTPTVCPHCGSKHFVKNGKVKGQQRFLCRSCKRTFADTTGTILFRTKKDLSVWEQYIRCLIDKKPLRQCAAECGISLPTAFYWRHKILDTLQTMMNDVVLDGVVEADETFFRKSYKGNHKNSVNFKMPCLPRKRGGNIGGLRGLSQDQVCVPCGINLNGLSIAKASNLGKPHVCDIESVLTGRIAKDSVFVTDSFRSYLKLLRDMELNHFRIPRGKHVVGSFNIQIVNSYHSELKRLIIGNFKGVSTKHLNNYLVYHNFVNFAKESIFEKNVILFDFIRKTSCRTKCEEITKRAALPF